MSILIKDMKMPKCCSDCLLNYDQMACAVTGTRWWSDKVVLMNFESEKERLYDCPLVEVNIPHGDLVDKDKLMMSIADWWYSSFGEEETDEAKAIRTVMDKIEQSIGAMTVVKAEGSEE